MLKYSNSKNQTIAQQIADLTISNYEKGLALKEDEENGDDDDGITNTIIPTADVSIKTKSGYSVKNKVQNKAIVSAGKSLIDTFISQSHILDNELLQLMTMSKVSNTKEIYGGSEKANDEDPVADGDDGPDTPDDDPDANPDDADVAPDYAPDTPDVADRKALESKLTKDMRNTKKDQPPYYDVGHLRLIASKLGITVQENDPRFKVVYEIMVQEPMVNMLK